MKTAIFAGGNIGDYKKVSKYLNGCRLVICADSGVHHAFNMGITPDILVGDMDSISSEDLKKVKQLGIEILKFPTKKDCTDTELALETALKQGAKEVIILGGYGDRPDHSLGNIFLMVRFKKLGIELKYVDEYWEVALIDSQAEINGKKGNILSLIPITPEVKGITTEGLYYPLKDAKLIMGPTLGISNVFSSDIANVIIKEGLLLAVKWTGDEYKLD